MQRTETGNKTRKGKITESRVDMGLLASKYAFIADIAVFLTLVIFSFLGAKKGAIKMFIGFFANVVAIFVAFSCASVLESKLDVWFGFSTNLGNKISSWLPSWDSIENVSLPAFIKNMIPSDVTDGTLTQKVGYALARVVVEGGCAFVLYFLTKLVLKLLAGILTGIANRSASVGAFNIMTGAILGAIKGFLIVCVALAILSLFPAEPVYEFFSSGIFVQYLYDSNPLMRILTSLLKSPATEPAVETALASLRFFAL